MSDTAYLNIGVDSTDTDKAAKSLDNLADFAEKAEKATGALGQAVQKNAKEYKSLADMADDLAKSERKAVEQIHQRAKAYTKSAGAEVAAMRATEKSAQSMSQYAAETEKLRAGLTKLLTAIDPLEARLNKLDDAEEKLTQTFKRGIIDAEKYAESLAKIGAQRNDIAEKQLKEIGDGAEYAAGMMEKLGLGTRLAQQDLMNLGRAAAQGDLKQVQNSIFQLTRNTGALSLALSAAGAAAGVAVGSIALLGTAYYQGYQRTQEFNRSIALTGNALGVSAAEMAHMTAEVGRLSGSYAQAERAANLIVRSGRIASGSIQDVMKTAVEMQQAFGQSVDQTISEFERLGESPSQTLLELNEKYRFLTAAVYEQVRALEDQGRMEEATALAQAEASRALDERAAEVIANVGSMERAWLDLKNIAAGAWEAMKGIGAAKTVSQEIKEINDEIASIDKSLAGVAGSKTLQDPKNQSAEYGNWVPDGSGLQSRRSDLEAQRDILEQVKFIEDSYAELNDRAEKNREKELENAIFRENLVKTHTKSTLASELEKINADFKKATEGLEKGGSEYIKVFEATQHRIEQAKKKYEKSTRSGGASGNQFAAEVARLKARIAEERDLSKAVEETITQVTRLNQFERKAMQLREQASKETKAGTKAQLEKLAALNEEAGALVRNNKLAEEAAKERLKYLEGLEKSTKSTYDEAQKLRDQAQTMGMSRMALEALTTARIEEQIAQLQTQEGSEEEIKLLREQIAARHELTDAIGQQEMARASYEAQQELERDWQRTVDNIDDVFRRGFADMLNEGKGSWSSFTKSLATTFKTTVADQIYKMFAQPFVAKVVVGMAGGLGMGGVANAMGGGSFAQVANEMGGGASQFGMVGGMSWLTNFGGNVSNTLADFGANLAMNSDMFSGVGESLLKNAESIGQFADLAGDILGYGSAIFNITKGNWGAGLGGAAGTAFGGPIGGAIGSTLGGMIDGMLGSGETRGGGYYQLQDGTAVKLGGASGGDGGQQTADAVGQLFSSAQGTIDSLFKDLGIDAGVAFYEGMFEDSKKGRGGVFSGGILDVSGEQIKFGTNEKGAGYGGKSGSLEEMFENMQKDLAFSTLEAWQSVSDQMPDIIGDSLKDVDVRALSAEQAAAMVNEIQAVVASTNAFINALNELPFSNLKEMSFDASAAMLQLFGGVEQAMQGLGVYYQEFYSESERIEHAIANLTKNFAELGYELPASRDAYRELVESIDVSSESGQELYVQLIQMSGAFASVTEGAEGLEFGLNGMAEDLSELMRLLSTLPFNHLIEMGEETVRVLAEMAGGIDAFASSLGGYYQNFFTEQERFIAGAGVFVNDLNELGLALPAARDGFRGMMDSIDLTTTAGQEMFAALLGMAEQADDYYRYVEQTQKTALAELADAVSSARKKELEGLKEHQDQRMQALRESQSKELDALRGDQGEQKKALRSFQSERMKALRDEQSEQVKAVRDSYNQQAEVIRDAISSISDKLRELSSLSGQIHRGLDALRGFSDLAVDLHRQTSRGMVDEAIRLAQDGRSLVGFKGLEDAVNAVSQLDSSDFNSKFNYELERAESSSALKKLGGLTNSQVDVQDLQLSALEKQLEELSDWRDIQLDTLSKLSENEMSLLSDLVEKEQEQLRLQHEKELAALSEQSKIQVEELQRISAQETDHLNAWFDELLAEEKRSLSRQVSEMMAIQSNQYALEEVVESGALKQHAQMQRVEQAINASTSSITRAIGNINISLGEIPGFATGGRYGGGLAVVGEQGPEIINFDQPGMVYTNAQSKSLMANAGAGNDEVAALLRQLLGEIKEMRYETRQMVINTAKILGLVDDATESAISDDSIVVTY